MNKSISTTNAPSPFSNYSQAVETPPGARMLHISGQVGNDLAGQLPDDSTAQNKQAWANIFAILQAADMDKEDIVEVLAVVRDHSEVATYRETRDGMLDGHQCASTMLVCGLASPDWKVEIAVRAAKQ